MLWPTRQQCSDEEMDALWLFLQSLPATTQGNC